jgi:hypothetical protein
MKNCKHCGESIQWHPIFGWFHGEMGGGWNTSCENDIARAEPEEDV